MKVCSAFMINTKNSLREFANSLKIHYLCLQNIFFTANIILWQSKVVKVIAELFLGIKFKIKKSIK